MILRSSYCVVVKQFLKTKGTPWHGYIEILHLSTNQDPYKGIFYFHGKGKN